ncbi:unnamed protein product [Scytosiphon promiscuus]
MQSVQCLPQNGVQRQREREREHRHKMQATGHAEQRTRTASAATSSNNPQATGVNQSRNMRAVSQRKRKQRIVDDARAP